MKSRVTPRAADTDTDNQLATTVQPHNNRLRASTTCRCTAEITVPPSWPASVTSRVQTRGGAHSAVICSGSSFVCFTPLYPPQATTTYHIVTTSTAAPHGRRRVSSAEASASAAPTRQTTTAPTSPITVGPLRVGVRAKSRRRPSATDALFSRQTCRSLGKCGTNTSDTNCAYIAANGLAPRQTRMHLCQWRGSLRLHVCV